LENSGERMDKKEPVIQLRHVTVSHDGHPALEDISLTIFKGDLLGIIGPNGGGKTTLLKVILGLVTPLQGQVEVFGGTPARNRHRIGYVPQYAEFDPDFPISVEDVVTMGCLKYRRLNKKKMPVCVEKSREVMERMGIWKLRKRKIGGLSGGEKQRVLIARALVMDPEILLLDEPTASVDSHLQATVYDLLLELNQTLTICLVSHDIGVISAYVRTLACLNRRLFYHGEKELTNEILMKTYRCPVQLIAHGVPHRVLKEHG